MLLKVCVNGARGISEHPRLSDDARLIAREAAHAVAAGAGAVHMHPKSAEGRDSREDADVSRWVEAVRAACPGVPVGVTTGAWAASDTDERARLISGWSTDPDFQSVNWHEAGADWIANLLLHRGIGVEAGIWHGEDRSAWPALDLAIESGLDSRIGLEDCLLLPDGSPAEDNAALVTAALQRV